MSYGCVFMLQRPGLCTHTRARKHTPWFRDCDWTDPKTWPTHRRRTAQTHSLVFDWQRGMAVHGGLVKLARIGAASDGWIGRINRMRHYWSVSQMNLLSFPWQPLSFFFRQEWDRALLSMNMNEQNNTGAPSNDEQCANIPMSMANHWAFHVRDRAAFLRTLRNLMTLIVGCESYEARSMCCPFGQTHSCLAMLVHT